jgi:transcriptional regulator with XRE-family HTH domain
MTDSNRPGLARCAALSPEQYSNLQAKQRFAAKLDQVWPGVSQRKRAARLGVHESTLRGWLNEDALDRVPSAKAIEKLARYEQFAALQREFGALG